MAETQGEGTWRRKHCQAWKLVGKAQVPEVGSNMPSCDFEEEASRSAGVCGGEGLEAELRCPQEMPLGSSLPAPAHPHVGTSTTSHSKETLRKLGPARERSCRRDYEDSHPHTQGLPRPFQAGRHYRPINSNRQTGATGGSAHGGHDGHSGGRWSRLPFLRWQCWRRTGTD